MDNIAFYRRLLEAEEKLEGYALLTIVETDGEATRTEGRMAVFADGSTIGTIGGGSIELRAITDAKKCMADRKRLLATYENNEVDAEAGRVCSGKVTVLIEPAVSRPLLVMCGAGHVGTALMRIAKATGFAIMLVESRDESVIGEGISLTDTFVRVDDYESGVRNINIPPDAYVVTASFTHATDGDVLSGILRKELAYIGMMASPKKKDSLFAELLEKGFTQKELERVHSPVGLNLGGETPEEIAVSILAEILAVKNKVMQ